MPKTNAKPDWRSQLQRLEGAYSPSTMRSYRADAEVFESWCQDKGIPAAFPASVETVCLFLEEQGKTKAPATTQRRLYSIRKFHKLLDLPDPTQSEEINLTFRKVRRSRPSRQRQAKGLTRSYLEEFLESEPDTVCGLRNRAMMALGYELMARRSELVALRDEDLTLREDGTLRVLIRRSKTDPFGLGRYAFTSKRTADLVQNWLHCRGPEVRWLFCPVSKGRVIDRGLNPTIVPEVIKNAAERAGLDPDEVACFSGHSMRVGAAQDLLKRGLDTAAIMRAGGWKSVNTLARYLEKADQNVWA